MRTIIAVMIFLSAVACAGGRAVEDTPLFDADIPEGAYDVYLPDEGKPAGAVIVPSGEGVTPPVSSMPKKTASSASEVKRILKASLLGGRSGDLYVKSILDERGLTVGYEIYNRDIPETVPNIFRIEFRRDDQGRGQFSFDVLPFMQK